MLRRPNSFLGPFAATALLLVTGTVTGCASPRPLELKGGESFAVIFTTPVDCVARGACVARVTIKAINGEAVGNFSTKYNYQVPPGDLSVVVMLYPIGGDNLKGNAVGICELKWTAVAGELYTLDRVVEATGFLVIATKRDGERATTCFAPFE